MSPGTRVRVRWAGTLSFSGTVLASEDARVAAYLTRFAARHLASPGETWVLLDLGVFPFAAADLTKEVP